MLSVLSVGFSAENALARTSVVEMQTQSGSDSSHEGRLCLFNNL